MHCRQIRLAPIANGVEPPGFEPLRRLLTPALAPISAEFALEVGGVKIEGATMIERALGLGPQPAAVVVLAPVRGKLSIRRWQIAKHKLAAGDIGFPSERNHIHPDREEAIAIGGDEPPSPVTLFGPEEAGRSKTAGLQKPTEAVAPRGVGKPLRDCARFLGTFGPEHLGRAHLLRPLARKELTETVHDPVIRGAIGLDARRSDDERLGSRWTRHPKADQHNMRGIDCAVGCGDRQCARLEPRGCQRRSGDHAHRPWRRRADRDQEIAGTSRRNRHLPRQ
jgi:hypothetical protein